METHMILKIKNLDTGWLDMIPLNIKVELYFLHKEVVRLLNVITLIRFLSFFRSLNNALLIIWTRSLELKRYFLVLPFELVVKALGLFVNYQNMLVGVG